MENNLDISYYLELQKRAKDISLYVTCAAENFDTFSVKIENLYVDACAFFDSLCQSYILYYYEKNQDKLGESPIRNLSKKMEGKEYFRIKDYYAFFTNFFVLSQIELSLNYYETGYCAHTGNRNDEINPSAIITPFEGWNADHAPLWWKNYTKLKHNRIKNYKVATLKELLNSLGASLIFVAVLNDKLLANGDIDDTLFDFFTPRFLTCGGRMVAKGNLIYRLDNNYIIEGLS